MKFVSLGKEGYYICKKRKPLHIKDLRIENFKFKKIAYGIYQIHFKDEETGKEYTRLTDEDVVMRVMSGHEPNPEELQSLKRIAMLEDKRTRLPYNFHKQVERINAEVARVKREHGKGFRAIAANGVPFYVDKIYLFEGKLHYRQKIGMGDCNHPTYSSINLIGWDDGKKVVYTDKFFEFTNGYLKCIHRGENPNNSLWSQ